MMSLSIKDVFTKSVGLAMNGAVAAGLGYLTYKAGMQGDFDVAVITGAASTLFTGIGIASAYSNFTGNDDENFVRKTAYDPLIPL